MFQTIVIGIDPWNNSEINIGQRPNMNKISLLK